MEVSMNYPLTFSFRVVAFAPQLSVRDSQGNLLLYVKQKMFKLKEAVGIFADEEQTRRLFSINADRVLDISARYDITDSQGMPVGAVKRQGMRSFWKAHYDILNGTSPVMTIREENPWVKVLDSVIGEVPVLGLFTGYLFNPSYLISREDGSVVMRLEKQRSFLESRFVLERKESIAQTEEQLALLGLLMMILLERRRG
jgi:uncharacterized protein YxjI